MARIASNGIEIEYEIIGERGVPLLLIMGLGAQLVHWPDELCSMFVDRGFQLIRFDNRDVGLSSQIREERVGKRRRGDAWRQFLRAMVGLPINAPYTLDAMADDTAGLLEAIGIERAHVLGASLGGMIGQTLAIRHPVRVLSLTSIMSTPGGRGFGLPAPRAMKALLGPRPKTREEAGDNLVRTFRVIGSPGFYRDEERIREIAGLSFDRCVSPAGLRRQFLAVLASGSRYEQLQHIDVPALVVHGSEDPLVRPTAGQATAAAIPGARFRLIEGMGHDLVDGVWPIVVDEVAALVAEAGYDLAAHAQAS